MIEADLGRTITIRAEAHSVMHASNRRLAHYPQFVGQLMLPAKHFAGELSLSVPRNKSAEFNLKVPAGVESPR